MIVSHKPLFELLAALGIEHDQLSIVETPTRIAGTFPVTGTAISASVTPRVLDSLAAEYGSAVTLTFQIGALGEFTFDGSYSTGALAQFLAEAGQIHTHDLLLEVDKKPLAERLLDGEPPCEAVLYFTEDAAVAALRRSIGSLEKDLWSDISRRLMIFVLDRDVLLSGESLSIVGGVYLGEARAEAGRPPVDPRTAVRAARRRDDYIGWDTQFATSLTPWHFYVEKANESAIGPYVDAAFVLLAVLFTCDRARATAVGGGRPRIQAEFRGREHVALVPIIAGEPILELPVEARTAVRGLLDWCYQTQSGEADGPDYLEDRLPFVQMRVAQALEGRSEETRFRSYATSMPDIYEGARWQWRAFLEGRVSEYLDKVRQVEGMVADTVNQYAEKATALAKSLADSMLAAVAALIGSFIAAALKEPFDVNLFRIGLLTYAGYVLLFPGMLGLLSNKGHVYETKLSFDAQRERFTQALYAERVDEIVGSRVTNAEVRYQRWLRGVGAGYLALCIAAVVGAYAIPRHVDNNAVPTTTTTVQLP